MFDLSALDSTTAANEGAVLHLRHPATGRPLEDAEGNPITITLAGSDSDAYRKAQRQITNRRLAETKRRGGLKLTSEELEEEALDILAVCTLAWSGIVVEGEALACTAANARKVYQRFSWIKEQADEFIGDRSAFLGN